MIPNHATLEEQFELLRQGMSPVPPLNGAQGPFLSVITRTQGRRPGPLRDALLSLMAQRDENFEVLLLMHRVEPAIQRAIEELVASFSRSFASRVRPIPVETGSRTTPLNVGFAEARGSYASILDDDDLVFDHWVSTFRDLATIDPDRVLRTVCLVQDYEEVAGKDGERAARACGPVCRRYSAGFDWLEHFSDNASPTLSLAYPVGKVRHFGLKFDESLTTLEDWDFLLRAGLACGVASAPEATALYRLWPVAESSVTVAKQDEWDRNRLAIEAKMEAHPFVQSVGGLAELHRLWKETGPEPGSVDAETVALRQELESIYASWSWRLSKPIRWAATLSGRKPFEPPKVERLDKVQLHRMIGDLRSSLSWRVTAPVRSFTGLRRLFHRGGQLG